jgi:hypothetical protein
VCPKKREAIQKAKEERTNWRERVRGGKNIPQSQEVPKENEDGAPATEEAEKKTGESQTSGEGQGKEEVQVPATQQGSEESIPETQW